MKSTRSLAVVTTAALLIASAMLSACSVLGNSNDPAATAAADVTNAVADGTALRMNMDAQSTAIVATAAAAGTYIVERESINAQLLATMRVVIPPTQQVINAAGAGTPNVNALPELPGIVVAQTPGASAQTNPQAMTANVGGTQYTQIQTTDAVSDADGCAIGSRTEFTPNDTRIYISARALGIAAGTVMGAQWELEGSLVYDGDSFTVSENDDDFCLWFYIDPPTVPFTPGQWRVQLTANGQLIEPAVNFTITGM